MNVLHLIHWPRTGITRLVKDMVSCDSRGNRYVIVLLVGDVAEFKNFNDDVKAVTLESSRGLLSKLLAFIRLCDQHKPDVIHTHSFTPSLLASLNYNSDVRYVRTVHSIYPYFTGSGITQIVKRQLEKFAISKTKSIVVCVENSVETSLPWDRAHVQTKVIPNGIYPRNVSVSGQASCVENVTGVRLLALGRLEIQKGFDLLVSAIDIVRRKGYKVSLDIYGEGGQGELLKSLIDRFHLGDEVSLKGFVSAPWENFYKYDWLISPSRYEGFGLSIIEAMSSHLPVIVTQTGGVPNILENRVNAVIIKNVTSEEIADAIIRAVTLDKGIKEMLRKNGKIFVDTNYNINNTVEEYNQIYMGKTG